MFFGYTPCFVCLFPRRKLTRGPNILTWLRGFQNEIHLQLSLSSFSSLIPKRDFDTKETPPSIDVCSESLGAIGQLVVCVYAKTCRLSVGRQTADSFL